MSKKEMKVFPPKAIHDEFKNALAEVIRKYGADLGGMEMLAVASQVVGMLIALQDQRTVTPAMAMEVVAANIETGNVQAQLEVQNPAGNG